MGKSRTSELQTGRLASLAAGHEAGHAPKSQVPFCFPICISRRYTEQRLDVQGDKQRGSEHECAQSDPGIDCRSLE